MSLFAIFFSGKSCLIGDNAFTQVDPTHYVLDLASFGASLPPPSELHDVGIMLLKPNALPPDAAVSLYVSTGGSNWSFRGYISDTHPSDVLPLSWPDSNGGSNISQAKIGISLEPLAEVLQKEGMKMAHKEEFAKRVGLDLFNFMQSFGGVQQVGSDQLLVPANVLDRWYQRLATKLQRDPDFLTRQKDQI